MYFLTTKTNKLLNSGIWNVSMKSEIETRKQSYQNLTMEIKEML